jgi:hypothetical protein
MEGSLARSGTVQARSKRITAGWHPHGFHVVEEKHAQRAGRQNFVHIGRPPVMRTRTSASLLLSMAMRSCRQIQGEKGVGHAYGPVLAAPVAFGRSRAQAGTVAVGLAAGVDALLAGQRVARGFDQSHGAIDGAGMPLLSGPQTVPPGIAFHTGFGVGIAEGLVGKRTRPHWVSLTHR